MTISPAQLIALTRARALLDASGVPYVIQNAVGELEGPLAGSLKSIKVTRPGRRTLPNLNEKYNWRERFVLLKAGEGMTVATETVDDAQRLGRNMSAAAHDAWGKDSYITSVTGTTAEVLRVL